MTNTQQTAWLIALPGGPRLGRLAIKSIRGGVTMGRHQDCTIVLPADAETVSRRHASFNWHEGGWRITDLKSRTGTYLNGVRLVPWQEVTLVEGDLVRIAPWTFRFTCKGVSEGGVLTVDDGTTAEVVVRRANRKSKIPVHEQLLPLLLEGAAAIHAATDEVSLAHVLMKLACRGTGLPNAAVLRGIDGMQQIEVIATNADPSAGKSRSHLFSRTLLVAAAQGNLVELSSSKSATSHSIVQMKITAAICVPLIIGETISSFLYLDVRDDDQSEGDYHTHAAASDFCQAIATIASLALGNLKRKDVECRASRIQAEIEATGAAQRWILPQASQTVGPFQCVGQSRAGEHVGGDFFDIISLPDGRMAVAIGDVSGHSASAAVLMAAAQGYLHAALLQHGDPTRAVTNLNEFVCPRSAPEKFITVWVGIFDPQLMTLTYVDAGHGYAMLVRAGTLHSLCGDGGGLPIGVDCSAAYLPGKISLSSQEKVLIFTDGFVEQKRAPALSQGTLDMFGLTGIEKSVGTEPRDIVTSLFQSLEQFAGCKQFTDDVTAVAVTW